MLWNPSIGQFAKLPSLEIRGNNTIYNGFGYDHSNDTYKVVAFSYYNGLSEVQTHVHTMGTYFWKRILNFPRGLCKESGKFVSGTLNWLPYDHSIIVSLDLEKESYR